MGITSKCSCTGMKDEREVFTALCKSWYGVTDGSGPGGCTRSKTMVSPEMSHSSKCIQKINKKQFHMSKIKLKLN